MTVEDDAVVGGVWSEDFMDRGPSAEFLTKYILANEYVKVLNVNSPWGAGKSFFLERWAKELGKKHVCVSFNAWDSDYTSEPLVALISCIEQQVVDALSLASTDAGKGIINAGSLLVKRAGPLILKGLIRKVSGVELDDFIGDGAGSAVDDVVKALIEEQAGTKENIGKFKTEVKRRLQQAAEDEGKIAPAFIFIDELDRCRPTYAIELLERIKHFFELEDCRFIIASDSTQLAHSIRAVYGQGFSSERYLNRFFDAEFKLDNQDVFSMVGRVLPEIPSITLGVNVSGLIETVGHWFPDERKPVYPKKNTVTCSADGYSENAIIVVALYRYFKVELRELVNYVRQIKAAADSLSSNNLNFFWLAFLVFYKNSKHESYAAFFDNDKGGLAFQDFDRESVVDVTLSFTLSIESLQTIAMHYLKLVTASASELRAFSDSKSDWERVIYYSVCNNISELQAYRKIVDLAHRLS